jgi:predicted porin
VTPQFQLVGGWFHVNANNVLTLGNGGGGTANMYMAGINYFLSKRTLLYVDVGTVRNGTGATHAGKRRQRRSFRPEAERRLLRYRPLVLM